MYLDNYDNIINKLDIKDGTTSFETFEYGCIYRFTGFVKDIEDNKENEYLNKPIKMEVNIDSNVDVICDARHESAFIFIPPLANIGDFVTITGFIVDKRVENNSLKIFVVGFSKKE